MSRVAWPLGEQIQQFHIQQKPLPKQSNALTLVADKSVLQTENELNHFATPSHSMQGKPTLLQVLLGESARRASAFEDELDNQLLPLQDVANV